MDAKKRDLLSTYHQPFKDGGNRKIQIFVNEDFDMMHYGCMNKFWLWWSLFTQIILGVKLDESISWFKVDLWMQDAKRITMVMGCNFVNKVVPGCTYVSNAKYVEYVTEKSSI